MQTVRRRRRWWYFKNLNHSNISMIIKLKHFIHTMTDSHQAIDCFRFVWTVFGAVAWPVAIACCIIFGGKKTRWVKVWLVHTFKVHFHGTNHNYEVKRTFENDELTKLNFKTTFRQTTYTINLPEAVDRYLLNSNRSIEPLILFVDCHPPKYNFHR